jgi:hypothetical protein
MAFFCGPAIEKGDVLVVNQWAKGEGVTPGSGVFRGFSTTVACIPTRAWKTRRLRQRGRLSGAGLRHLPVAHEGNQSSSREEPQLASPNQVRTNLAMFITGFAGNALLNNDQL